MDYKEYTGINKIIKSVSFELVPIGNTRQSIRDQYVIEEDALRMDQTKTAKEVNDSMLKDFLSSDILEKDPKLQEIDWVQLYDEFYSDKSTYEDHAAKIKELIAKELPDRYNEYIRELLDYDGNGKIVKWTQAAYLDVVIPGYAEKKEKFRSDEVKKALDSVKSTYNSLFQPVIATMNRILCGTGKGSVAERMLDNFEIMADNMVKYQRISAHMELGQTTLDDMNTMRTCFGQKGIDVYNGQIGGKYEGRTRIEDGINAKVNYWNQENPDKRLPILRKLKKQILADTESAFKIEKIETVQELRDTIAEVRKKGDFLFEKECRIIKRIVGDDIENRYNRNAVFITRQGRCNIAQAVCRRWDFFETEISEKKKNAIYEEYYKKKGKEKTKLTQKELAAIDKAPNEAILSVLELNAMLEPDISENVDDYLYEEITAVKRELRRSWPQVKECSIWNVDRKTTDDENTKIKAFLDANIHLTRIYKLFDLTASPEKQDAEFVNDMESLKELNDVIIKCYNMVRNYVAQKPADKKKENTVRLCFGRAAHYTQAWKNKQEGKFGNLDAALIEYRGSFFYIVPAAHNESKLNFPISNYPHEGDNYNYLSTKKGVKFSMGFAKFMKENKTITTARELGEEEFDVVLENGTLHMTEELCRIYENKEYATDAEKRIKLLDFMKEYVQADKNYSVYHISGLKESSEYLNLKELCDEIDSLAFMVDRKYVSKDLVDKAVEAGNLYMFLIRNQDMYKPDERCHDVTSARFVELMRAMFTGEQAIIINNNPAISYRKPLMKAEDMHPVGSILVNKRTTQGKHVPEKIYKELYGFFNGKVPALSQEAAWYADRVKTKVSDFAHVKDARYTREIFTINFTYTMNKSVAKEMTVFQLNEKIREDIRSKKLRNKMSVIRGKNNLLYYCVLSEENEVIEHGPLNEIDGIDYYQKLTYEGIEKSRETANWKRIRSSLNIKESYLAQIAREIIRIAIRNEAVIFVDKFSEKQKNKKQTFDNKLYKKFEIYLINALSDFYDMEKKRTETGGVLRPLQLAVRDTQTYYENGIVFWVPAYNAGNICFESGFAELLDTYYTMTVKAKKNLLKKIRRIWYNGEEYIFDFSYRDVDCILTEEEKDSYNGIDRVWSIRTNQERCRYNQQKKTYEKYNGNTELCDYIKSKVPELVGKAIDVELLDSEGVSLFYEVFKNSVAGYIPLTAEYLSPVVKNSVPDDADFHTAKALALKGCIYIQKIQAGITGREFNITRTEWLNSIL